MTFDRMESAAYLSTLLAKGFSKSLASRANALGFLPGQFPVLVELWNEDGITQRELLDRLDIEQATLANTLYFQPRFDDLRDIQLLDVLSLDVSVTGHLSVSLQGTLRYETPVPEPIRRTDLVMKNLIGVTF